MHSSSSVHWQGATHGRPASPCAPSPESCGAASECASTPESNGPASVPCAAVQPNTAVQASPAVQARISADPIRRFICMRGPPKLRDQRAEGLSKRSTEGWASPNVARTCTGWPMRSWCRSRSRRAINPQSVHPLTVHDVHFRRTYPRLRHDVRHTITTFISVSPLRPPRASSFAVQ